MNIPPFWARQTYSDTDQKGKTQSFLANGWSFISLEDARDQAAVRARKIFEMITTGQTPETYLDYLDRPIQEEIIETVADDEETIGIITRNRYGAAVLNTNCVLIADVDFPTPSPAGFWQALHWLISGAKRKRVQENLEVQTLQNIHQWADANPTRHFRLYRTRRGLRIIFTDKLYDPQSDETRAILDGLESDPLYKQLTDKQQCFRARLTPKPWRCKCQRPPSKYPWDDHAKETQYRQWQQRYENASTNYKTCVFMEHYGSYAQNDPIQKIIDIHDRWTCSQNELPLA